MFRVGILDDPFEPAERVGYAREVLWREKARFRQVVQQPLDGRCQGVGCWHLGRPSDRHEEERDELEAALENLVHCAEGLAHGGM